MKTTVILKSRISLSLLKIDKQDKNERKNFLENLLRMLDNDFGALDHIYLRFCDESCYQIRNGILIHPYMDKNDEYKVDYKDDQDVYKAKQNGDIIRQCIDVIANEKIISCKDKIVEFNQNEFKFIDNANKMIIEFHRSHKDENAVQEYMNDPKHKAHLDQLLRQVIKTDELIIDLCKQIIKESKDLKEKDLKKTYKELHEDSDPDFDDKIVRLFSTNDKLNNDN